MIGSGYDRSGAPELPVGPRVRVYELAKDLGLQPKDLVAKVRAMGFDVANHMSQIEPAEVDRIKRAVDRERHESLVEERLTVDGTVIRRRSKVVAAPPAPARQVEAKAAAAVAVLGSDFRCHCRCRWRLTSNSALRFVVVDFLPSILLPKVRTRSCGASTQSHQQRA